MEKFKNIVIKMNELFINKNTRTWFMIPMILLSISSYFIGSLLFQISQDYKTSSLIVIFPTVLGLMGGALIMILISAHSIIKEKKGNFISGITLLIIFFISIICLVAIIIGVIGYLKYST